MPKGNDNHQQPLGIRHRLFNFIVNSLIGQGFKRVTLGRASTEVPIDSVRLSKSNGQGASSPDVMIEFSHIEGLENSKLTPVKELGSHVGFPRKNGMIVNLDKAPLQKVAERKEIRRSEAAPGGVVPHPEKTYAQFASKGAQEREPASTGRGLRFMVSIKEGAGDRENYKNKDKHIPVETIPRNESEETKVKPLRPPRPLLMSVASNINEKADAFIRSRKEAMNKNYSIEPRKS